MGQYILAKIQKPLHSFRDNYNYQDTIQPYSINLNLVKSYIIGGIMDNDMDIQYSEQADNYELDLDPLDKKDIKKLVLSNEAQHIASSILSRRTRTVQTNRTIDPNNNAQKYAFTLKTKQFGQFEHLLTKNKHRNLRVKVIETIRELAQQRNHVLSGRVNDKLERSKMVLRVVSKEEQGKVIVEDQTGKEHMIVRNGTVWVGMIALMEVTWSDNSYKLEILHDLGVRSDNTKTMIKDPNAAFRMLFVRGGFMSNESRDNIGLKILTNELRILKDKQKTKVNCLVIMGPLLNKKNKTLTDFMEMTFQEQAVELIKVIREEVMKINDEIQIVFVPSTDDLTNFYPIPQPKYSYASQLSQKFTHFTSNPGFINLLGSKQNIKIDLINVDVLNYIDQNRTGKSIIQLMQENIETYFKQPFYLTNTIEQPFDETNLPGLYNQGHFGDIIITTSKRNPPFAREARGKVFVNIGSMGIDEENDLQKHYMTLLSIFDGSGPIAPRTKVETLSM